MKIYLAHNFLAREFLKQNVVPELVSLGHVITSNWLEISHPDEKDNAILNLSDIDVADAILLFTDNFGDRPGKGKYVELGYAIGKGKKIFIYGKDTTCVFYHLDFVTLILSLNELQS